MELYLVNKDICKIYDDISFGENEVYVSATDFKNKRHRKIVDYNNYYITKYAGYQKIRTMFTKDHHYDFHDNCHMVIIRKLFIIFIPEG